MVFDPLQDGHGTRSSAVFSGNAKA